MTSPSPASSALVEHISAQGGSLPSARRLRPYLLVLRRGCCPLRAAGAEGALVHLAAHAESAALRELRRAERAGVEAVAAADAEVLVVQHDAFCRCGRSSRPGRPPCRARRSSACRPPRSLRSPGTPSLMVTTRRRFTPQGTSCSFLQAVTQPLHSMQRSASQRNFIRAMRLLRRSSTWQSVVLVSCIIVTRVVAVGRRGVDRLAAHDRVGAGRVVASAGPRPATSRRSGTA